MLSDDHGKTHACSWERRRHWFALIFFVSRASRQGDEKLVYRLISCSPSRKSLVKGERFVRDEGKPEVT